MADVKQLAIDSHGGLPAGLSAAAAAARLAQDGPNELPADAGRSVLAMAWGVAKEPMIALLLACGGVYLLLGDRGEAWMLLGFVGGVAGLTLFQEWKTERALDALRNLASPRALVIRDGTQQRIAGREVVVDDIVLVAEGDRIPADAALLQCQGLAADESLLTGESVPVRKVDWNETTPIGPPGGDDLPFIYSGTLAVKGRGLGRVLATGARSEIGKIGTALQSVTVERTIVQQEVDRLVRRIAIGGGILCAVVVLVYGLTRGHWLDALLAGLALAMGMLPEEFPVVLTIFLAIGTWRMSKRHVLTRRLPVIETLGSATVLCVDKTGTLTENRMTVQRLATPSAELDLRDRAPDSLPEEFHALTEFGILASQQDPFDAMEKAFHELGIRQLSKTEHLHQDWELVREYPLSRELFALSHVWRAVEDGRAVVATKGAPEAIVDLCHLDEGARRSIAARVDALAADGLRVLGVARGVAVPAGLPENQHDFTFEFLGLVGLADPVRASVPAAIQECATAGIRVVMITGDHPATARSIARQIGLRHPEVIMTGPEMAALDEDALRARARDVDVFARVVPDQKLRLVNALKANGEVVAMTGDGVNDAPALKAAHIGIAMGGRGTDVAREAASLVLLDDDFASIVAAVRMGRRILDHLRKAMVYIVAVHVPIAGLSLLPVLFGWPLILMPVHILFLELIIDPTCTIVFEAEREEEDIMRRPPRRRDEPLFGRAMITFGLWQGLGVLATTLLVFGIAHLLGDLESDARALGFTTLVLSNLGLMFVNRSWERTTLATMRQRNRALWWVVGGAVTFLLLALYVPALRPLFHFEMLHPLDLGGCLVGAILSVLWVDLMKLRRRRMPETAAAHG